MPTMTRSKYYLPRVIEPAKIMAGRSMANIWRGGRGQNGGKTCSLLSRSLFLQSFRAFCFFACLCLCPPKQSKKPIALCLVDDEDGDDDEAWTARRGSDINLTLSSPLELLPIGRVPWIWMMCRNAFPAAQCQWFHLTVTDVYAYADCWIKNSFSTVCGDILKWKLI